MGYITAIKIAILVFPVLALVLTLPYIIVQYFKYGSVSFLRSLILFTFIFYMLCAYFLVIMPLPHRYEVGPGRELNLVPFKFVEKFRAETVLNIHDSSTYVAALRQECLYVVLFNILLTMPFGMYMKYYFRRNFITTTFLTFCLSAFFEFTQYTGLYFIYQGSYRICDVDDLIQNTLGGMLGYMVMCILRCILPLPNRESIDKKAYVRGLRVSGLRRTVMCGIDFAVFGGVNVYLMLTVQKWNVGFFVGTFLIYYVLFPMITHGRTLGSCITRLRLTAPNHMYIRMIIRNIYIAAYYVVIPVLLGEYLVKGAKELPTSRDNKMIIVAVVVMAVFMFYLIHAICVWSARRIYYDMWFKTAFVSTIKVHECEASPEDACGYIPSEDAWLVKPSRKMFTNPLEFEEEVRRAEEQQRNKSMRKAASEKRQEPVQKAVPEQRQKPVQKAAPEQRQDPEQKTQPGNTDGGTDGPEIITDPGFDLWAEDEKTK